MHRSREIALILPVYKTVENSHPRVRHVTKYKSRVASERMVSDVSAWKSIKQQETKTEWVGLCLYSS